MAKRKAKTNKGIVLIKKSNNLIESRYKFDIWETRFFLSVLSQIRREDNEFKVYRIWYKDVIKTFNLRSNSSYDLLRKAAQSLMGKSFFVSYEQNGAVREQQYHILRKIDYLKGGQNLQNREQNEYIDVTVEHEMKPLLLEFQKNFTAYDLRNVIKLGVYPVRVYELLKQYQSIGKRTLEVEEMKRLFEVTEQYKQFGNFNRWVIKPAIKEINKYTDLTITSVEKLKKGRRVAALRFSFQVKEPIELLKTERQGTRATLNIEHPKLEVIKFKAAEAIKETAIDKSFTLLGKDVVERFGVTSTVFLRLLETYSKEQVERAIRVTNRAKFQNQIKTNIAGFFIKALKDGYTDPKEEALKKKRKRAESAAKKQVIEEKIKGLEQEKEQKINERIRIIVTKNPNLTTQAIQALSKNILAKVVINQREKDFGRKLTLEDYRQEPILRGLVKSKIVEMNQSVFLDIISDFKKAVKEVKSSKY